MADALELQAIALVKKHGWVLPADVKEFLRQLADRLAWAELRKVLK